MVKNELYFLCSQFSGGICPPETFAYLSKCAKNGQLRQYIGMPVDKLFKMDCSNRAAFAFRKMDEVRKSSDINSKECTLAVFKGILGAHQFRCEDPVSKKAVSSDVILKLLCRNFGPSEVKLKATDIDNCKASGADMKYFGGSVDVISEKVCQERVAYVGDIDYSVVPMSDHKCVGVLTAYAIQSCCATNVENAQGPLRNNFDKQLEKTYRTESNIFSKVGLVLNLKQKLQILFPALTESTTRLVAAAEAMSLQRGGITEVAHAAGISRATVHAGIKKLKAGAVLSDAKKSRRKGCGWTVLSLLS